MNKTELVYTTYIRSTAEKVWAALTNPEFTRQYWGGYDNVSDWKKGSQWKHVDPEGTTVRVIGEVLESNPPKRLVFSWAEPSDPKDVSRVTYEIEQIEDMVCLKVIHDELMPGSTMATKVNGGWPRVIASLKSFLETGTGLNVRAGKSSCGASEAKGCAA